MAHRRAVVVGSGLGGLLAAEALASRGWRVTVLERRSMPGGKFAGRGHSGFQVPTGAFHTIPYGRHGFLGRALAAAGVRLRLAPQPAGFVVRTGDQRLRPIPLPGRLPLWTRNAREIWQGRRFAAALLSAGRPVPDVTVADFLTACGAGPQLRQVVAKIVAYSSGIGIERASAVAFMANARAALRWPSGVIRGGCGAVVEALLTRLRACGVRLVLGGGVKSIAVAGGAVQGVECGDTIRNGVPIFQPADLVVSNAGPSATARLLGAACPGWLRRRVEDSSPAHGIAYAVRSRCPLVPHLCVELPLDACRIAGYHQVTNAAPELAPPGWHLLLAFAVLADEDARRAIQAGKQEILGLFPGLQPADVLHVAAYRARHPATETPAAVGWYGSWRYPLRVRGVQGLMMIGHDSVGIGFAAETIGYAALRLARILDGETRLWTGN